MYVCRPARPDRGASYGHVSLDKKPKGVPPKRSRVPARESAGESEEPRADLA